MLMLLASRARIPARSSTDSCFVVGGGGILAFELMARFNVLRCVDRDLILSGPGETQVVKSDLHRNATQDGDSWL